MNESGTSGKEKCQIKFVILSLVKHYSLQTLLTTKIPTENFNYNKIGMRVC